MPTFIITSPDGKKYKVTGPEGSTKEQALQKVRDRVTTKPAAPTETYDPTEGMSTFDKTMAGAGKSVVDVGRGIRQLGAELGNKVGLVEDETVGRLRAEETERARFDAPLMNTKAGMAGYVGGSLATTLLPAAIAARGAQAAGMGRGAAALRSFVAPQSVKAGMATGAIEGAIRPVGTDESRLENMGVGTIAGGAGTAVAKGIERVAQPIKKTAEATWQQSVDLLKKHGVPLDTANLTGNKRAQWVKRHVGDNPFTKAGQERFADTQQKAVVKAFMQTVGEDVDSASNAVLGRAKQRIGKVYEDFAAKYGLKLDTATTKNLDDLATDIADEVAAPAALLKQIERIKAASKGETAKAIDSALGRLRKSSDGITRHYAGKLQDVLRNAVEGAAPAAESEALRTARKQWRNLIAIEKSRSRDASRNVSILRLSGQNGADDLMQLVAAARQVLPDAFQNSGTASRIAELAVPGLAAGIVGGVASGDMETAGLAALTGLGAPFAGQALLRSPATNYLANGIGSDAARNALTSPALRALLAQSPTAYLLSEPAR
jgi:hypothetical protein